MKNLPTVKWLSNRAIKNTTLLLIATLFSVRVLSQQIILPEGIMMPKPMGAVALEREQLASFIIKEKYPHYLVNMAWKNIYTLNDLLIGISGSSWSILNTDLEKAKTDWDKVHKKYKENPNYWSVIKHINENNIFITSHQENNSIITHFYAFNN